MKDFIDFLNESTNPHLEDNAESGTQSTYKHFLSRELTDAQKKSGDYAKGRILFAAGGVRLPITIENPRHSVRVGINREWMNRQAGHYGYIENTKGADGDELDVVIGTNHDSDYVLIINQVEARREKHHGGDVHTEFDEHKIMLGYDSKAEALKAYFDCYDADWEQPGDAAVETKLWLLDEWIKYGDTVSPFTNPPELSKG